MDAIMLCGAMRLFNIGIWNDVNEEERKRDGE